MEKKCGIWDKHQCSSSKGDLCSRLCVQYVLWRGRMIYRSDKYLRDRYMAARFDQGGCNIRTPMCMRRYMDRYRARYVVSINPVAHLCRPSSGPGILSKCGIHDVWLGVHTIRGRHLCISHNPCPGCESAFLDIYDSSVCVWISTFE